MIDVRGRLRKPSKRTSLIVAIILGIGVAGFAIGSSFGNDEILTIFFRRSEGIRTGLPKGDRGRGRCVIGCDGIGFGEGCLWSLGIWPAVTGSESSGDVGLARGNRGAPTVDG